jgi:hypothetical protein
MAKDMVDVTTFKSICEPKFDVLEKGVAHLATKVENGLTEKVALAVKIALWSLAATITFLATTVGVWLHLNMRITDLTKTILQHVKP